MVLATLDLLLRGLAVGAGAALGLVIVRSAPEAALRRATLLFIVSNIAFILNGHADIRAVLGPLRHPLWLVQIGGAGYFWMFVRALFQDSPLGWRDAVVPIALTVVGIAGLLAPPGAARLIWGLHNLAGLALALHALLIVARSWRGDLVEARRRLRGPFLSAAAIFSVVVSLVQIGQVLGYDAAWYEIAFAGIQAALGLAGAVILLEARESLFGASRPAPVSTIDADSPWLARLDQAMREDRLWQREGLTIADLAATVGLPEHRLRRLINDRLGHRNFPAFVNQHRITAARKALADPGQASRTVAAIAYDLGFGSLGPFNRAFREATGQTPTDFRRSALGSPIPENPS